MLDFWNSHLVLFASLGLLACGQGADSEDAVDLYGSGGSGGTDPCTDCGVSQAGAFALGADFSGPCEAASGAVDVNLGNTAESAVRALHCQVFGEEPSTEVLADRAEALRSVEWVRRVDVARGFCQSAGRECGLRFSDPWAAQISHEAECDRTGTRDVGAVMMFFSECPGGINCDVEWANTHALGMATPHAVYGFGPVSTGYYHPGNAGFWRRELLDARWAGLSFLLLNTYGPDIEVPSRPLARAVEALDDIGGGIGLAMMDDTWMWGRGSTAPFDSVPDLADTEGAATTIYQAKWRPFYQVVPKQYWYTFQGRPLIYFYNAGTLTARDRAAPVIRRMKEMFAADFGVEPFVAVDSAFFADETAMNEEADARFTWDTFRFGTSESSLHGVTLQHAMVRWDAVGRDRPGQLATESDRMHKGPQLLEEFLASSADADIAVIATWNDLGEGTGIHRNYDYFYGDTWLPPDHFLSLIRDAQCQ